MTSNFGNGTRTGNFTDGYEFSEKMMMQLLVIRSKIKYLHLMRGLWIIFFRILRDAMK